MPAKNTLIEHYQCKGHETLETLASIMQTRGFFTSNQAKSFQVAIRSMLPCEVKIEQRMPKSVIYVTANTKHFTINNRAKLTGVNT
jgi:ribosomal protein L13